MWLGRHSERTVAIAVSSERVVPTRADHEGQALHRESLDTLRCPCSSSESTNGSSVTLMRGNSRPRKSCAYRANWNRPEIATWHRLPEALDRRERPDPD